MVKAWIADVSPLLEQDCYDKYYRQIPDFRKKKADALRLDRMKAQSVGVWILWEKIRAKYNLREGAPHNFSHSGNCVMCAVCMDGKEVQVGCDVEKIGKLRMNVAERSFCREEYEAVAGAETEEARTELFFRYWVLKESFMKATRKGMALPVNSFCISMGNPPVLIRQPEEFTETYHYQEYSIPDFPYRMAVCATDAEIDTELHTELIL